MRLDFDGELDDEFFQFNRKRYRNAIGETQSKTDSAINLGAPISVNLTQPTSTNIVGSGVTSGGSGGSTPTGGLGSATQLNQPATSLVGSGVTTGGSITIGGLGTATELNQPVSSPPVASGVTVGGSTSTSTPSPTPTPTTTSTTNTTPTFTEGLLLGSGLLGATLQNATSPKMMGGAPAKPDKGEVVFPEGMQPKSTTKSGLIAPLLIGTLVVGSLYLILKGK